MEDSFFGFNTTAPPDGDVRLFEELSEDEYDALNDETFGEAIISDWEENHETLVRNLGEVNGRVDGNDSNDEDENSDLGLNLSNVKLDDVEICSDDNESRLQLDLSVWSNPIKPEYKNDSHNVLYTEPYLRQNFPYAMEMLHGPVQQTRHFGIGGPGGIPRKICTVEDIERNIRNQQQLTKEQNANVNCSNVYQKPQCSTPTQLVSPSIPLQPPHPANNFINRPVVNVNFNLNRPSFNGPPVNVQSGPLPPRLPHGFSPIMPFGHTMPPNPASNAHHANYVRSLTHNLPIALNNFAMHPNFNAMRPIGSPMPPQRLPPHPLIINSSLPPGLNQYNQRLMQEIQQNHPMLANTRVHPGLHNFPHLSSQMQAFPGKLAMKPNARSNGNVPEEYDEYANLMSTRDKHWLIAIQLSQLNTDTPYIDDYYYTVFKERRAKLNGDNRSKTHKDNQLNHPLTQPKGHAQLILISMGKNGTNSRIAQNRERKNSETKNDKEQSNRVYPPLQFENSLGKLQYGSVTAPRKIIDMDVMGNDSSNQFNSSVELSTQRKSRQLLLHIETLYRIVLKLEDLQNPAAIATSLIVKEKREREQQLNVDQPTADGTSNKDEIGKRVSTDSSVAYHPSESALFELESKDKLLQKLIPCLSLEKVIGVMSVRKGKTLIRRILSQIEDEPIRWTVWVGVFSSLCNVLKKDKDDSEGVLFALYPELNKQIRSANLENLVLIAEAMPLSDKKLNNLFASKFCISSLVTIIIRAEEIYSNTQEIDLTLNSSWTTFLSQLSASLSRTVQQQTISAAVESNTVQPLVNHFSRFNKLELRPLLAFFSQGRQKYD